MANHEAERPGRNPLILPPRKPMLTARRVSLFDREVRVRLSPAAIEVLFANASVLSEGGVATAGQQVLGHKGPESESCYFGSTMITIDLARASSQLSEACDAATMRTAEVLLSRDSLVRERAREIAIAEAGRLAGGPLDTVHVDLDVRQSGRHFHVDMNVEAKLRPTLLQFTGRTQ